MAIFDLFSKRQRPAPEVFTYNDVPRGLRVQIVHILKDALGLPSRYFEQIERAYQFIHDGIAREHRLLRLAGTYDPADALFQYFLDTANCEQALDVIELAFRYIDRIARRHEYRYQNDQLKADPDEAIAELNERFLEHAVGYQFEAGKIIRLDSKFLHAEAVKPALNLLADSEYAGPNQEFLNAHGFMSFNPSHMTHLIRRETRKFRREILRQLRPLFPIAALAAALLLKGALGF